MGGMLVEASLIVVIVLLTLLAGKGIRFISRYAQGAKSRATMSSMQFAQLRLLSKDGVKEIFNKVVSDKGEVRSSAFQIGPFADGAPVALVADANLFTQK